MSNKEAGREARSSFFRKGQLSVSYSNSNRKRCVGPLKTGTESPAKEVLPQSPTGISFGGPVFPWGPPGAASGSFLEPPGAAACRKVAIGLQKCFQKDIRNAFKICKDYARTHSGPQGLPMEPPGRSQDVFFYILPRFGVSVAWQL